MNNVTCILFNKLARKKVGEVTLAAVPRAGDRIAMQLRTFEVSEVWHVEGKGIFLIVHDMPTGLPAYMKDS